MAQEEDINDELKEIVPGFPVKKSFDPPAGYFKTFPDEVLNRWRKEVSQPVVRKMTWKSIIGIAAVLTGLSIGGWWFLSSQDFDHTNEISAAEAYQYINENIDEFETLIETSDLRMDDIQPDVPHEDIEEYLMEEMHGTNPEDLF